MFCGSFNGIQIITQPFAEQTGAYIRIFIAQKPRSFNNHTLNFRTGYPLNPDLYPTLPSVRAQSDVYAFRSQLCQPYRLCKTQSRLLWLVGDAELCMLSIYKYVIYTMRITYSHIYPYFSYTLLCADNLQVE